MALFSKLFIDQNSKTRGNQKEKFLSASYYVLAILKFV